MSRGNKATQEKYVKTSIYSGFIQRFPRAMEAVAALSRDGCKKHDVPEGDTSFTEIENAPDVLREALVRHLVKEAKGEFIDPEWNYMHAVHEAWNAMGRLETLLKKRHGA